MKVIKGNKDFGLWLREGKFYLVSNWHADNVIKKGYATEIMEITQSDLAMMLNDFSVNGMPKELVKYFQKKKGVD